MASAWHEGRRAWKRLDAWQGSAREADRDGSAALEALTDLGAIRRLLERAEWEGVRAARGHGRSWAEIATRLGVTRQSAWERWRDLDEEPAPPADSAPEERVISQAARQLRRRSQVRVPDVVGRRWDEARQRLMDVGLVAVGPDPDGPPLAAIGWPDGLVVADQSPESGARVARATSVTLWLDQGGGGAGVREPRRPRPDPLVAREARSAQPKVNE